jgi:hypothetical protein
MFGTVACVYVSLSPNSGYFNAWFKDVKDVFTPHLGCLSIAAPRLRILANLTLHFTLESFHCIPQPDRNLEVSIPMSGFIEISKLVG